MHVTFVISVSDEYSAELFLRILVRKRIRYNTGYCNLKVVKCIPDIRSNGSSQLKLPWWCPPWVPWIPSSTRAPCCPGCACGTAAAASRPPPPETPGLPSAAEAAPRGRHRPHRLEAPSTHTCFGGDLKQIKRVGLRISFRFRFIFTDSDLKVCRVFQ